MEKRALEVRLLLRALDQDMANAWWEAFDDIANVDIQVGDILKGVADAIVSPSNSFGYMDGGIDSAYRGFFGVEIESRLQEHIGTMHEGELPVGQGIVVETGHAAIPFLVAAPTMRVPTNIHDTVNVYLAFRAALLAVRRHNASHGSIIRSLLAPAFGTGVGSMSYLRAARQMAAAYRAVVLGEQRHLADARSVWRHHHELLK
jgi:O-acetyl-ADP-ribose deacetylase (regulator of RNase III)